MLPLVLPLVAFALQAPTMFSVSGTVTDITGAVVAEAVVVVDADGGAVATTRTLPDGTFQIQTTLRPLRLRVSKKGFNDQTLQLGSQTSNVQIQLGPSTLVEMTTVMDWNRIPIASIETIDVRRGGAGDLFGSDAMGGAIEITPQEGSRGRVWMDGGSHGAARVSAYTGLRSVNWLVNGAIEASTSDGFVVVAPESRGPIDTDASQRYFSGHREAQNARHRCGLPGSTPTAPRQSTSSTASSALATR